MTTGTWVLLGLAIGFAVFDWFAVGTESRATEVLAKPATLALLAVGALLSRPAHSGVKLWLVVALVFGLIGDVALLGGRREALNRNRPPQRHAVRTRPEPKINLELWSFPLGMSSFLLGQLSYCVAILNYGVGVTSSLFGLALVALMLSTSTNRIVRGAYRQSGQLVAFVVASYFVALSACVVLAVGTSALLIAYGSLLFAASDLILSYDRFAKAQPWARVAIVISYHAAQVLLLIGLVR